jgi:hypothetical protein
MEALHLYQMSQVALEATVSFLEPLKLTSGRNTKCVAKAIPGTPRVNVMARMGIKIGSAISQTRLLVYTPLIMPLR